MKRELKFRAWIRQGEWNDDDKRNFIMVDGDSFCVTEFEPLYESLKDIDDEFYIMQYIGLKDKNKKEIYEGDILKTETDKLMIVSWSEKYASFVLDRKGWAFSHWFGESCEPEYCEVVGNIYETPELLTES